MRRLSDFKPSTNGSLVKNTLPAFAVAIAAILCLSACGIKGDLKRPGPIFDKNQTKPPVASTPLNTTNPNTQNAQAPTSEPAQTTAP